MTVGRERMQLSVTTASLEEAEEAGTGRYHWLEHDVSIRCGGRGGNGISVAGGSDGSCKGARAPESPKVTAWAPLTHTGPIRSASGPRPRICQRKFR
ncbi:hypothetical protein KCMC57_up55170 [Kitasatospora sp. CMC57]|uniref:Uncharacterized protein n=1 Tax=Kitasatospora sp. CMC57 TaxID=3231513 RepID=A0AB33K5N0_9ACTN